jgi:hypothetical protein
LPYFCQITVKPIVIMSILFLAFGNRYIQGLNEILVHIGTLLWYVTCTYCQSRCLRDLSVLGQCGPGCAWSPHAIHGGAFHCDDHHLQLGDAPTRDALRDPPSRRLLRSTLRRPGARSEILECCKCCKCFKCFDGFFGAWKCTSR